MRIKDITAAEFLDSRGMPTVWAQVTAYSGAVGEAIVPSGASTGSYEAHELRDGGKRLGGKGVRTAVQNITTSIANALSRSEFKNIAEVDAALIKLDGTPDFHNLGANAVLAVSVAAARVLAAEERVPLWQFFAEGRECLPMPMMNILNGGAHADNSLDIQEFMIIPSRAGSFAEAVEMCQEVYMALKSALKRDCLGTRVGDEGGFAPDLSSDASAIEYILRAAGDAGVHVSLALDAAASEWQREGAYMLPKAGEKRTADELIRYYEALVRDYPIVSIEDGLGEDDVSGWQALTEALPHIQLVGDDLFVTNEARIRSAAKAGYANAVLIKPNQTGTVSGTLAAIKAARESGYRAIVSHRSGDSEDAFIADLAVGTGAGQIKTGAPARAERTAKYNRLLAIELSRKGGLSFSSP